MDDNETQAEPMAVKLWRAWRTVHEMVAYRGYELSEEEVNITLADFKNKFVGPNNEINRSLLRFSALPSPEMMEKNTPLPTPSNPEPTCEIGTIYIEFVSDEPLGISHIRKFLATAAAGHHRSGILVTHVALSPGARTYLESVESILRVEYFVEDDLLVNITKHELVPRHILLSPEEKVALLKRYRLKETQLPRILRKDPVAKYLGLRKQQVVKIIRVSETAGRYASYRLCV